MVDLRGAAQQEVFADPAVVSFGAVTGDASGIERIVRIHNISTRRRVVSIGNAALAPKGVEITADPQRVRLGPGESAAVVIRADTLDLSDEAGIATGELVLRAGYSPEVHVPWAVAVPQNVDLISRVSLEGTGDRVSDATPSVLALVAGAVTVTPDPQVRAVDRLEVQLWRGKSLLGVLARRRELLPGRYTFGLTGRGSNGERLRRGMYAIRIVALPGDGTRRQSETVDVSRQLDGLRARKRMETEVGQATCLHPLESPILATVQTSQEA